jgi:hypothetical protein
LKWLTISSHSFMYKKKPKETQMEIACSASRVVDVHVSSARYEAHLGGPSDHGVGGATQRCKHDDDVRQVRSVVSLQCRPSKREVRDSLVLCFDDQNSSNYERDHHPNPRNS